MGRIPAVLRNYITWPLLCTLVMLLWTAAVSPYTKYGDDWAATPVEVIFIVAVVLHLFIIVKERWRPLYLFYAAVHVPFSFIVGTFCLMLITKSWF